MDYEELLRKYLAHVVAMEGTDFLSELHLWPREFTDEEIAALERLSPPATDVSSIAAAVDP